MRTRDQLALNRIDNKTQDFQCGGAKEGVLAQ
jgi:hypothetical protein